MNSRYIFTQDSFSNTGNGVQYSSISPPDEERLASSRTRLQPVRSSPTFLTRLAMRVSRAKWYSFLRRVYLYQNGTGSDLGPNPLDSREWMLTEFMSLVVQIVATVYTLGISKDERPVWPMRIWISGYVFGCLLGLVLLYWRYRLVFATRGDTNSGLYDVERQRNHDDFGSLHYMYKCKDSLELLFAIWFVMGNVWVFDSRFGSFTRAPKLHILCIALLAWNAISYSFPFLLFVLLCCFVPLVGRLLGYNMNAASVDRGATDEQIASLPSWKFKDITGSNSLDLESSVKNAEIQECCICLAKYKDKEEIRQLTCTHIFHLKCVDQWLRIISCCPLCKQGI